MQGVIAGMISGITFTASYIIYFKFVNPTGTLWWGISPEGIGTIGMMVNFVVTILVSLITPRPPQEIRDLVDRVRIPRAAFGEKDTGPVDH